MIEVNPKEVTNQTSATLSCNLTSPASPVTGHHWEKNGKVISTTQKEGAELYTKYTYVLFTQTLLKDLMLLVWNTLIVINPEMGERF